MAIWGRLKDELDRAGRAAQKAVDEGKVRLDLLRARQRADKAAQTLGYAVFHARKTGGDLTAEEYHRLAAVLTAAQTEVDGLERQLAEAGLSTDTPAPCRTLTWGQGVV